MKSTTAGPNCMQRLCEFNNLIFFSLFLEYIRHVKVVLQKGWVIAFLFSKMKAEFSKDVNKVTIFRKPVTVKVAPDFCI